MKTKKQKIKNAVCIGLALSSGHLMAEEVSLLPEVKVADEKTPQEKQKEKPAFVEKYKLPNTVESVTQDEIDERVNIISAEDALKYEPSLFVRKRFQGETNAPLQTRTATASQSARTMIYADGILISNYMGNNNSNTGSPRWNTVAPGEIERYDFLYGPYSAQYAGNSVGGVLNITTKMPTKFEAGADIQGSWGSYNIYNHKGDTNSQNYSAFIGDKVGDWSVRFDFNHIDAINQPIAFATQTITGTTSGNSATQVATQASQLNSLRAGNLQGAVLNANSYGVPMLVTGATNIDNTHQDNFKWKLAYDITPTLKATYTLGMWQNLQTNGFQSYLPGSSGSYTLGQSGAGMTPVTVNLNSGPSFAQGDISQTTFSHGMGLKSDKGGKFDWELNGSVVDLADDNSRVATVAPSVLQAGTSLAGRNTVLTGSNWNTADAKGIWRPGDYYGKHEVSFGFHNDGYQLKNPVYNLSNWANGSPSPTYPLVSSNTLYQNSEGKTQTQGYWLQDSWDFTKEWNATFGGRLENWDATDGVNGAWVNNQWKTVSQHSHNAVNFSPKGKITWNPNEEWRVGGAIGQAYRYPTAAELFQTTTIGAGANAQLINGNPNLLPERALSSEVSAEYFLPKGKMRLSVFQERVNNAIYSVATLLPNGGVASQNYNVGQTDTYGLEFSGEAKDVWIDTLNFYGSATWTDAHITHNTATDLALASSANATVSALASNPGAAWPTTGAFLPRIPTYRASWTVSYEPVQKLTTSVSGRYMSASFSQLNNSDINHATYIGNSEVFVVDLKANYKLDKSWSVNAGIDNVNNNLYWVYHPFPMRTYIAQIKYTF